MRRLAIAALAGLCVVSSGPAAELVRGEGRAPSALGAKAARDAALTEALHDAVSHVGVKVRGVSLLDQGVLRDSASTQTAGHLRLWRVISEGREGSFYVVRVEGQASRDSESCAAQRADIDLRAIDLRVAPGLSGAILRHVQSSLDRAFAQPDLGDGLRIVDQRHLPAVRGGERVRTSQYDYMAQLTDSRPSPSGHSLAGEIVVERVRGDNAFIEATDVVMTAVLRLTDNYTGATVGVVRRTHRAVGRRAVFGLDEAFARQERPDFGGFFESLRAEVAARIACRPLRAFVLQAKGNEVLLSVGLEHGVEEGDHFLVTLDGRDRRQAFRIVGATPTQSVARVLKPGLAIPPHALATLLR